MKKQHNEFDDFLKSKEEEFHIPFKEEYWEKASAFLEANRTGGFWNLFLQKAAWWGSGITLLVIGVVILTQINSKKDHNTIVNTDNQTVITQTDNKGQKEQASNDLKSNSSFTNEGNNALAPISSELSDNQNKSKLNSNNRIINSNPDNSEINQKLTVSNQGTKTSFVSKPSQNKNTSVQSSFDWLSNTPVSPIQTKSSKYFPACGIPAVPVFEEMTIDDKTIPLFYGLPYQSKVPGSSSRKIREFSRGGLYPQLTFALAGGVNIFNSLKEFSDTNGFISSNPYFGVKTSYQLNSLWIINAQLIAIQRGGVNQQIIVLEDVSKNQLYRQLYSVQLPLSIGYFLNKKNAIHLGVAPMINVASTYNSYNTNNADYNKSLKFSNTIGFSSTDVQLSVGYSYRLNKKINFCATYFHGLTDITKTNTFTNNLNHRNHFVSIGINYNLMQKKVALR